MKIGELSARTNVSADTLRFYEKRGLISSERLGNGYRDFDHAMIRLVGLVRLGQKLGFSLKEIQGIVDSISNNALTADETAELLRRKLSEIDVKMDEMSRLRSLLTETLDQVCPLGK